MLREVKRHLREHPLTRDLYRLAADRWARLRIAVIVRHDGRYYTASRLDRMFLERLDPWSYAGDANSEQRRRLTLNALPRLRYERLLEIGCAEGWMSEWLAERANELVCVDVSAVAIERARARCARFPHVRFVQMDVLEDLPAGPFDAIACCGVLVMLPLASQDEVRDRLVKALRRGGDLVLENQTHASPGSLAGAFVAERFHRHPELDPIHHERAADYDIDVFRRK